MATYDLLARNPSPTDEEIKDALDGNLCRCTGYESIMKSVRLAAKKVKEGNISCRYYPA
jgi:aerobic-type carbon monoxide dehydrogenase small subunit (CoxS/CutS family)